MWQGLSEARYQCHRSGRKGDARKRSGMEAGGIQRKVGGDAENATRKTEMPGQNNSVKARLEILQDSFVTGSKILELCLKC